MNTIIRLAALTGLTITTGAGESPEPVTQQAYVKASNAGMNDQFGWSGGGVALAGDTLVVGAPGEDSSAKGVDGDQGDGLDPFPRNPVDGFDSGAAYVFTRKASIWDRGTRIMASNAECGDQFGGTVAISGATVAVGAVGEDGVERGVNGNQGDDYSGNTASGAAYVFAIPGADSGGTAPAGAGEGKGTLDERILGFWAPDWDAMAKSWQPFVQGALEMRRIGPDDKDRAAAEKEVVEELKAGFDVMTMEIKKGEMVDYVYPGRPDRSTYRVMSMDAATGTLKLEDTSPGSTPSIIRAVLSGDRLTLTEGEEGEHLPMVYKRIDAAAFEKRQKAAAESELSKDKSEMPQEFTAPKGAEPNYLPPDP